jgi:hypothetical protein
MRGEILREAENGLGERIERMRNVNEQNARVSGILQQEERPFRMTQNGWRVDRRETAMDRKLDGWEVKGILQQQSALLQDDNP